MSAVQEALPLPQLFYSGSSKNYYRADSKGRWIALNENSALKFIRSEAWGGRSANGLDEADACLLRIQSEQNVDYVGPVAGFPAGPREINGRLVLITDSPAIISPKAGQFPLLDSLLEGMFNDATRDQRPFLYGWLKRGIESVQQQRWSPGQVLALGGEVNSGKSLFQRLVTELLGGRAAKPYKFLTDRTQFNGDLFGAEHLMVEDEAESIDIRARRHFGAGIKGIAVNRDHQCHGKYREGLVLTPIWRMTISLNNEQERLQVLPPMDADIADKVMLLRVNRKAMPMPTDTAEEKERFWAALKAEMPAFVHFLLNWQIPKELICPRFGVVHYHHPQLLEALERTNPETRLLALIDQVLFHPSGYPTDLPFDGTAEDLEHRLRRQEENRRQVEQLLSFPAACGTYLGRLSKKANRRVSERMVKGHTTWTILPPQRDPEPPSGGEVMQVSNKSMPLDCFTPSSSPGRATSPPQRMVQGGEVGQVSLELTRNNVKEGKDASFPYGLVTNLPHPSTLIRPPSPPALSRLTVPCVSQAGHLGQESMGSPARN